MPAILVETAFITNASDAYKLKNRKLEFATEIANEILKYLNISTPPVIPDNPVRVINRGLSKLLGFDSYTLQSHVEMTHSDTIMKNKFIEVELGATLLEDEPTLPLSTENAKKIANMYNPQEVFDGATGILLDMLPEVSAELKIMLNGFERIQLSTSAIPKFSYNPINKELTVEGVKLEAIIRPFKNVRVKEFIGVSHIFDLDDLINGGIGLALVLLVAVILTPGVIDDAVVIIALLNSAFKALLT